MTVNEGIQGSFRSFPKLGYHFGVPILRIIISLGLHWGPLVLGNYHLGIYRAQGFPELGFFFWGGPP